MHGAKKNIKN